MMPSVENNYTRRLVFTTLETGAMPWISAKEERMMEDPSFQTVLGLPANVIIDGRQAVS
jgi:hypothetical protein